MGHLFNREDFFEGQEELSSYLLELSRQVTIESTEEFPDFLRKLAYRIKAQEIP